MAVNGVVDEEATAGSGGKNDGGESELVHGRRSFRDGRGIDMRSRRGDSDDREHRGSEGGGRSAARDAAFDHRRDALGKILTAARQSLVRRRGADPERARDVFDGALLVVIEDQRLAIDVGHLSERGRHEALALRLAHRLVRRGRVDHVGGLAERFAPAALARVTSEVASDPAQPGRKLAAIAQLGEPAPCRDECILREVVSERSIAHATEGDRVYRTVIALDDLRERRAITAAARLDQLAVRACLHVAL